jgi:hypothetical protein
VKLIWYVATVRLSAGGAMVRARASEKLKTTEPSLLALPRGLIGGVQPPRATRHTARRTSPDKRRVRFFIGSSSI